MKINVIPTGKCIAITLMLLNATSSFSQYAPTTSYQPHSNSSNYYPHDHDSATTVMPSLIKQNFLFYGFLSSLNQHISFEFSHQMNDDIMLVAQVGIINSGLSQTSNNTDPYATVTTVSGGYFEGGVKLFLNPDYTRDGRHGYYVVEGVYIKPQFVVSVFSSTSVTNQSPYAYPPQTVSNNYSYTGAAVIINFGGQWMIAHAICIDAYGGVGVSFSSANSSNEPFNYNNYSYLASGGNIPLAVTGGINIGLPF